MILDLKEAKRALQAISANSEAGTKFRVSFTNAKAKHTPFAKRFKNSYLASLRRLYSRSLSSFGRRGKSAFWI
ncbi:hypothetical protein LEP1GSC110_3398 [Leptospira interrogans serovar Medanensis str. UT053]|nr:hypothetical protein [Leptospira interrogans]EMN94723.1 hypothetical protein LEP1GSC110_3398 [Leptospira interrogans serovar Medanensis str. UT053]